MWREEQRVVLGPVWLFINLPFPLSFFGGVVLVLPLAHTDERKQWRDRDWEQSLQFLNQRLFGGTLTGSFTEVDVFPVKAEGIL